MGDLFESLESLFNLLLLVSHLLLGLDLVFVEHYKLGWPLRTQVCREHK